MRVNLEGEGTARILFPKFTVRLFECLGEELCERVYVQVSLRQFFLNIKLHYSNYFHDIK